MFVNFFRRHSSKILLRKHNGNESCLKNKIHYKGLNLYSNYRSTAIFNIIRMAHGGAHLNRLASEKSPYLQQHSNNPVDWYPWCDEAIDLARREKKVIFLSVGYSTCHWCHVMEKESFMDEDIAKIMNENFVNIKVDREERPDIDKLYMTFLLLVNGSGGWPMSVFLTPELTPITAGTYFPPKDRWGMPGFSTILTAIADKWKKDSADIQATGASIIEAIRKSMSEKPPFQEEEIDAGQHIYATVESKFNQAVNIYIRNYDKVWGGSNGAPKFPEMSKLNFKLHAFAQTADKEILDVALKQLDKMANGGIHDHIFGGFARYSVDKRWHVPHFEKMLYDQGQIMAAYVNAFKITRTEKYLKIADKIYQYICSDLRNPKGGFYSGEDADSLPEINATEKVEGAFYAWTYQELKNILTTGFEKFKDVTDKDVFEIFVYHYDITETGNVEPASDPHEHLKGKNILFVSGSLENTADKFDTTPQVIEKVLDLAHEELHKVRSQRVRPHLDRKIICSWNSLILSGLSKLSTVKDAPNKQKYLETAKQLYTFIREHLYDKNTGKLFRSCYGNEGDESTSQSAIPIYGFLDDYAFLVRGLIDYYVATLDTDALHFAKQLQDKQNELFWDNTNGGYFYTEADAKNLIVRLKEDHDGAEPCGNSVTAHNLVMLRLYFEDEDYKRKLEKLFLFFAGIKPFGYVLPEMMSALLIRDAGLAMLVVIGENNSEEVQMLFDTGRDFYVPGIIVLHVDPQNPEKTVRKSALQFKGVNNKATAYVCEKQVCNLPITDSEKLKEEFSKYLLHSK